MLTRIGPAPCAQLSDALTERVALLAPREVFERAADELRQLIAQYLAELRIRRGDVPIWARVADSDRSLLEGELVQRLTLPQRFLGLLAQFALLTELYLTQPRRLSLDLLPLAEELDEDGDLGAERVPIDGFAQVVHGADGVAAQDVLDVIDGGRDEDDRDQLRLLTILDDRGRLEPIHLGHRDIEQNDGKLLPEHLRQRFGPGPGEDETVVRSLEERLQRKHVAQPIIDEEDVDGLEIMAGRLH